jgi:phosphinothricin acetyltransferase
VIRAVTDFDINEIIRICNYYVINTAITFESEPVSFEDMVLRIENTKSSNLLWLVAQDDDVIIGYAYAGNWKGRCAYKHSVEIKCNFTVLIS